HYKYTFAAALPTFDNTQPVTVYMGAVRNTTDIVGKNYYATPAYKDYVPSTGAAATTFNAMTVARCNQCHDPLSEHGGNYIDIKTCVLCHNPNNMTGANTHLDGEIFFHALHQGKDSTIGPITYPQDIRFCATCHDPAAAGGGGRRQRVHAPVDRGLRLLPQRPELHDGREPSGRPRGRRDVRHLPPA